MIDFKGNKPIFVFAGKLLAWFAVWYLFYEVWLLPDGRLDAFLSVNIVEVAAGLLGLGSFELFQANRVIGITGTNGIIVVNGCNGLEAIGLFIGFVMSYPGDAIKRALFIPMGIFVIYLVNVFRIAALVLIQYYYPAGFDFAHDYSTSAIFYLAIFAMWVIWINFGHKPKWGKLAA
ncbi:exosortase family protein XrtF [Cyclonatronum proteinivorum]|uniref:Exosortase family protein XrtF n=1 Tax=Cyclonatronum proteinivorum TaxID=1457365 RepID=A0A345UHP0_9BACT|nr:archaeosortase/exosortase family protein [Cyclonatronum proteinivorum]AXI99991.1 exosortase family protein XrtF [Cyclonatronum proteinivorum]